MLCSGNAPKRLRLDGTLEGTTSSTLTIRACPRTAIALSALNNAPLRLKINKFRTKIAIFLSLVVQFFCPFSSYSEAVKKLRDDCAYRKVPVIIERPCNEGCDQT